MGSLLPCLYELKVAHHLKHRLQVQNVAMYKNMVVLVYNHYVLTANLSFEPCLPIQLRVVSTRMTLPSVTLKGTTKSLEEWMMPLGSKEFG